MKIFSRTGRWRYFLLKFSEIWAKMTQNTVIYSSVEADMVFFFLSPPPPYNPETAGKPPAESGDAVEEETRTASSSTVLILFVFFAAEHKICENSQNQCAGYSSDFYCTKIYNHSANTCYKNYAGNKKVAVFIQIDFLEHFET